MAQTTFYANTPMATVLDNRELPVRGIYFLMLIISRDITHYLLALMPNSCLKILFQKRGQVSLHSPRLMVKSSRKHSPENQLHFKVI